MQKEKDIPLTNKIFSLSILLQEVDLLLQWNIDVFFFGFFCLFTLI